MKAVDDSLKNKRGFKGASLIEKVNNYTVIDLETTGINILECEIIECSAVKIRNSEIIDTFSKLVKPSQKLSEVITNITGITDEMLENAPAISNIIEDYVNFIGNDIIIGHNIASFDVNIIYDTYLKYCNKYFKNNMIDTYRYAKYCNINVSDYKLNNIAKYFGIDYDAHRALNDCITNFKCYEFLKEKFIGLNKKISSENTKKISENFDLNGKQICLSGNFICCSKSEISFKLEEMGAIVQKNVTSKTDYLIVGGNGSSDWAYGDYGTKVKKALELQGKGKNIKIISEQDFIYD